jgi:DNA-binding NarL/FixJ family response regulator
VSAVRVLVVDDQPVVRAGFAAIIDAEPDLTVVAEAGDGAEAVRLAARHAPDVILMDIRMPGMDGLAAIRELAAQETTGRILVLTTFQRDEYVFAALRDGASGFLLKDCQASELLAGIRTVAAGDALLSPAVTRRVVDAFAGGAVAARPAPEARLRSLTGRETETLRHLAQGLNNAEIAAALGVTTATVKTHVNSVLAKLGARDRVQATIIAHRAGLVGR